MIQGIKFQKYSLGIPRSRGSHAFDAAPPSPGLITPPPVGPSVTCEWQDCANISSALINTRRPETDIRRRVKPQGEFGVEYEYKTRERRFLNANEPFFVRITMAIHFLSEANGVPVCVEEEVGAVGVLGRCVVNKLSLRKTMWVIAEGNRSEKASNPWQMKIRK